MFHYTYDEAALCRAMDIDDLDADLQKRVLERVRQLLEERMGIRIEMSLTTDELDEFNRLATDKASAKAYLEKRCPDIQKMYKEEITGIVQQIRLGLK